MAGDELDGFQEAKVDDLVISDADYTSLVLRAAQACSQLASAKLRVAKVLLLALRKDARGDEEVQLRRCAQELEDGRMQLLVLGRTHDSADRAPSGSEAFFDVSQPYPSREASYDPEDPGCPCVVFRHETDPGGWRRGSGQAVLEMLVREPVNEQSISEFLASHMAQLDP